MPKLTPLDRQWEHLMSLCQSESACRAQGNHPRLLKLLRSQIDELASELGFTHRQILTRDFRAERDGGHVTRIITD
jgi:AraC-like DNA-binding protein